ncbi:MAG: hypothetical protein IPJ65_15970 [Archangiaceae bacterium]|nr:hypothetical protein [Archangiaceae bacterium]
MRTLIGLFVVALAGCGVSESSVGSNEADPFDDGAELSATSRTYVQLRRDMRKCIAPLCGGYWVHDVNRANLNEVYVSALDFSGSGLSEDDQGHVYEALGEVVLRGKLGPKEARFGTRPFIVTEAYRGLPGLAVGSADAFFKVKAESITCIRAPCPSMSAIQVNHSAKTLFHAYDAANLGGTRLDLSWLTTRAVEDGAITAGTLVKKGDALTLEPSNVFVRLPERVGPCPQFKLAACPSGQVRTYTRTVDRCVLPAACITPGFCALFIPVCDEGYTLASWPAGNFGCNAYACDPTWSL